MNTLETVRNRYFVLRLLYTTCQMQKPIGAPMGAHLKLTDSNVDGVLVARLWTPEHIWAHYLNSLGGDVFPCCLVCPGHSHCTSTTSDWRTALGATAGSPKSLHTLQRIWNLAVAQYISPAVEAHIYPSSFQTWGGKGKKMGYFNQNPSWLQTNAGQRRRNLSISPLKPSLEAMDFVALWF